MWDMGIPHHAREEQEYVPMVMSTLFTRSWNIFILTSYYAHTLCSTSQNQPIFPKNIVIRHYKALIFYYSLFFLVFYISKSGP